jgi:hypothetical protein
MARSRLDFFIAGVQKAGTTALAARLRAHPEIALPAEKELHFFDDDGLDWSDPPWRLLEDRFAGAPDGALRGDATPIYLFWPGSLARMRRCSPEARLIVLLRHPVHRAVSHWRMERARGAERLGFGPAVSRLGRLRTRTRRGRRVHSYVERGFYPPQIRALLRHFPREQVLFLTMDALWTAEAETLERARRFLGLRAPVPPPPAGSAKYVAPLPAAAVPEPDPRALARLQALYAPQIAETEALTASDYCRTG